MLPKKKGLKCLYIFNNNLQ